MFNISPGFEVCCFFPFGLQCLILVLSIPFLFMPRNSGFHHFLQIQTLTLFCWDSSLPTFIGSWANLPKTHHATPLHLCPLIHDLVKHKFLCLPFNALLNLLPTLLGHFPLSFFIQFHLSQEVYPAYRRKYM